MRSLMLSLRVLLVLFLAICTGTLSLFYRAAEFGKASDEYPNNSAELTVSNVDEVQHASVLSAIASYTAANHATVFRVDTVLSQVDRGAGAIRIGVFAGSESDLTDASVLRFMGTEVVSTEAIAKLLAAEPEQTLGLDQNAADTLLNVPHLSFAERLSVMQLAELTQRSETVSGTYRFIGVDEQTLSELSAQINSITGDTTAQVGSALQGSAVDRSFSFLVPLIGLVAVSGLLQVLLLVQAFRSLQELGTHLILGWSAFDYCVSLFRSVLLSMLLVYPVSFLVTFFTMQGYGLATVATVALPPALVTVAITLATVVVASLVLLLVRPVTAIRNLVSKKIMIVMLAITYCASAAGVIGMSIFLDGPIREIDRLGSVSQQWQRVTDYQILYKQDAGDDSASFTSGGGKLMADYYAWYRTIAAEAGVSVVNTRYHHKEQLENWRELGVYQNIPNKPLWYFAASPSYLESVGLNLNQDLLSRADSGERVYLVPDSYSEADAAALKAWVAEDVIQLSQQDSVIQTEFTQNPRHSFESYQVAEPLFTWSADLEVESTTADPVILVVTPQNMSFFESESLSAIGLENSYIKLSSDAVAKYGSSEYLAKYNLDDNRPEFRPVSDFIAGLQKNIQEFLQLFAGVSAAVLLLEILALLTLTKLYAAVNRRSLAVKMLLGHSPLHSFRFTFAAVIAVNLLGVLIGLIAQSNVAVLVSAVMLVVQPAILTILVAQSHREQIAFAVKTV